MIMTSEIIWFISVVETFSLAVALVLVVIAYRGYRKSGSRSLLLAAIGFGILGAASLAEGVLYQFAGFPLDGAQAFRSTLTAIGLVVLVYSIYTTRVAEPVSGPTQRGHTEPAGGVAVPLAREAGRPHVQRPV